VVIEWGALGLAAAKQAIKPTIDGLKSQMARRDAVGISGRVPNASSPEIDEAISLLSDEPQTLSGFFVASAKKVLSDVPDIFADQDVRLWMQRQEVRDLISTGARLALGGQDYSAVVSDAGSSFAATFPGDAWWGEAIFDVAVAFVALSITGKMDPGQRALLDNLSLQNAQLRDRLAGIEQKLSQGSDEPTAADAVEALLRPEVDRAERLRSLIEEARQDRLIGFCKRVSEGDLRAAETGLKIDLYRATAACLARAKRTDEAEHWLDCAQSAGANDLSIDRARIALNRGDIDRVFALLRERTDSTAIMLIGDAIQERDGLPAAIEFVTGTLPQARMTGWALATTSAWLAQAGDWESAETLIASATEEQIEQNPILHYSRMRLRLAMMVNPESDRFELLETDRALPMPGRLRTDGEGQRLRTLALSDLADFKQRVPDLDQGTKQWLDAQRLFLEFTDPENQQKAPLADEIRKRCTDPETCILFSSLAASLDLDFDGGVLSAELARREAVDGMNGHELHAALRLVLNQQDPDAVIAFLDRYDARLEASELPSGFIGGLRIEATAKAGNVERARELLDEWRDRLGPKMAASVEAAIAKGEDAAAQLEAWQHAFDVSGSDTDLEKLVEALASAKHEDLGRRAVELWNRTHRVGEALQAANVLFNESRDYELDALLDAIGDAGDGSEGILQHRAWSAFRSGRLDEARERTKALRDRLPDDIGLRQLAINIELEAGRWTSLGPLAHEDLQRSENRTPRQLLQAAGLAQLMDDPVAEDLARAAVAKAPTDPHVLIGAFGAAIQRGTDWSSEAGGWLRAAVENSDESGPVQSAPLRDFVQLARDREEQTATLNDLIMKGQLPLEIAAEPLGITISELVLDRLPRNVGLRDARARLCLPLVAGNRLKSDLSGFSTFAFDLPSILILETVGLLDEAFTELPKVLLASGTLPHLLNDYIRASRGQKSRVAQAQAINDLLVSERIETLIVPETQAEELDEIEAAADRGGAYVHTFPIFEAGPFGEREMDVSAKSDTIVSPTGIINALEAAGELDAHKARAARSMLGEDRQTWPNEPKIDLNRPMLIEIVSLNALQNAGVLEVLLTAGAKLFVSKRTASFVQQELAEWKQVQAPLQAIIRVRDKLVAAAASGKASHGGYRRSGPDEDRDDRFEQSQLMSLLSDASGYDVLVSADRAINKLGELTDRKGLKRRIVTVVDVIDHLLSAARITPERWAEARQRLRECGVGFVPIEVEEIVNAASHSDWANGPSRALRAIFDSIHLPLFRKALVLPDERFWLANSMVMLTRAIKRCWVELPSDDAKQAATWLLRTIPDSKAVVRGLGVEIEKPWAEAARIAMHAMLAQPIEVPNEKLDDYHGWYAAVVAPQLGGRDREGLPDLIEMLAQSSADVEPIKIDDDTEIPPEDVCRWLILRIPPLLRDRVVLNENVQEVFGLGGDQIRLGKKVVSLESLLPFLKETLAGRSARLVDDSGEEIAERSELDANGDVVARWGDSGVRLDFAGLFADQAEDRHRTFDRMRSQRTMPASAVQRWVGLLSERSPNWQELRALLRDLDATPESWIDDFREDLSELTLFDLQALDRRHFEAFFELDSSGDLAGAIAASSNLRRQQTNISHVAFSIAPLAVCHDFDVAALTADLPDSDAAKLIGDLANAGDPFSTLAGFKIASARLGCPECVEQGTAILDSMLGSADRLDAMAHDFAAIARSVIAFADTHGTLANEPVAQRRCALLAHSGIVCREFARLNVERPGFLHMVEGVVGKGYRLGGLVERTQERWWTRERLIPNFIAGHVKARLKGLVRSIADNARPEVWNDFVKAEESGLPDLTELIGGPLDEASSGWVDQTFAAEMLTNAIPVDDARQAVVVLSNSLLVLEIPSDLNLARESAIGVLEKVPDELLPDAIETSLIAAMRWRDRELSEKSISTALELEADKAWPSRLLVEWAVASAAAASAPGDQTEILDRELKRLVERKLSPEKAAGMISVLDRLQDFLPTLDAIPALRSAAILAA
jgi:hypothetical protein